MEHIETEVKFILSDVQSVRERIVELGVDVKGRVFETNMRFDDVDESLLRNKSLLRLRRDANTKLTYKSEPAIKDDQFKTFRELEVQVSDFTTMKLILEHLGFHQAQIYEKWRETFIFDDTLLCLDTMPFGDFLEIEGKKEYIKEAASKIGLQWGQRITLNYLAIFEIIRQELKLPFTDVTFDNFQKIRIDIAKYHHLIEADLMNS
ncbi:MAG: class IV adenylate cyclase [Candidatus Desulfatibia sp.]|uniref:class IV adenylate cyclase n=1 Tax=Candidatus Desulfatibia sp. TaxID=3101189 RepID=UPI002F31DBC3